MSICRRLSLVAAALLSVGAAATFATPASAAVQPPPPGPAAQSAPNLGTAKIVDWNIGQGVNGFRSDLSPGARIAGGYPTTIQPSWPAQNEGFAGLINLEVISGPGVGTKFQSYCIDLLTGTWGGIQYNPGEWTEANVPNVGYVAQLLQTLGVHDRTRLAVLVAKALRHQW